ncbi:MAG TPA: NAD+ synthase, partial [Gemmatimonadales bacterium]|nr:NAD+ synthase [Gemmatimonadales bacterium]
MLHIALVQLRPTKGAYRKNLEDLEGVFREVAQWQTPPDVLALPETALTGYFLEGGVRDVALSAEQLFEDLSKYHAQAEAPALDISVGFYEVWRN